MDQVRSRTFQIAVDQIKRHRATIIMVIMLTMVATVLEVLSPMLFRFLVDEAITSRDMTLITNTLIGMVALPVAASGLSFLEGRQRSKIGDSVTRALREWVFQQVLSIRIRDLEQFNSGELYYRMLRACGEVGDVFVSDNLLPLIPRVFLLVGNVAAMFIASWRLALVAMVALPLLFIFGQLVRKYVEKLDKNFYVLLEAGSAIVHETLAGLRTIRVFNGQQREAQRWQQWNAQYETTKLKVSTFHDFWVNSLASFISNLVLAVVLGFGAFEILNGRLSVGGLIAFIVYAPRVLSMLQTLTRTHLSLATVRAASEKLDELFAAPVERESGDALPVTAEREFGMKVVFEDVSFRYGRGEAGISNLSFHVNAGEFVGIVGPSGGGKSTIFDLLSGFYELDSGRILVDEVDIREVSLSVLREAMGVVGQDTFLWNASLLENMAYPYNKEDVDFAWATRVAQLESVIAGLPDGAQTMIGERGQTLSGGERQRIAIARAVLRHPRLLLLDEATSALDPITEEKLRTSLETLRKGRTMIVIAHRLATVVQADRIVVIDKGRVLEQGSPAELLDQRGLFYAFYQAQKLDQPPTTAVAP